MKRFVKTTSCAVTVIAIGAAAINPAWAQSDLTVVSWGGSYTKSQILAYIEPYEKQTGISIDVEDYNGGLKEIRAQVNSYNTKWDLVDMTLDDVIRGCNQGLLEKIDHSILPPAPDGTPPGKDFFSGLLPECGVGEVIWSTVVAYDSDQFNDNLPKTIADFFNVYEYPGKRGLRKSPKVSLEWALLADGVPRNKIYETLSTPEGIERAFAKLDTIKDNIVWWEAGSEPPQLLAAGEVTMTSAYNGRLYDAVVKQGKHFILLWDGQVWDADLWAIPIRTRKNNLDEILKFVKFATDTQRLADQAKYIPYGPARKSSMAVLNESIKPYLPTADENTKNVLKTGAKFWAENQERLDRLFAHWLARKEPFMRWHSR